MTITRQNPGDVNVTLAIYRDGEKLTSKEGNWDVSEYLKGFEIFESINSATIEASLIIEDSGGLIGAMTGSELFKLEVRSSIMDRMYYLRSYRIKSRSRTNQTSDIYMLDLVSDEYLKNEILNVFGHSEKIFNQKTETSEIVTKLVKDRKYINSKKKLFAEETLNQQAFVCPNWRPFDTIYWMSQRAVRKTNRGNTLQNGFAFYENALGFNFKSIDKMIEDINNQTIKKTNPTTGKARLYTYAQEPKNIDAGATDQFKITTIVFPEEKNFLKGLRNGAWAGFSIGFDPVTISNSRYGQSTDMSVDAHKYNIAELWGKMTHLKGGRNKNPIDAMDKEVQAIVQYPKRVRYTMLPNQIFDPKFKNNPQKNYEQLVELQSYQWMRMESLKMIKLQIQIPGNLDLYVGCGIDITIASTAQSGNTTKVDDRYSGRYLIASLAHKVLGNSMTTELLLMKDSLV